MTDALKTALPRGLPVAAALLLALTVPAFWPAYLSRPAAASGYTHAHAALGTGWLLLLIVQPWLVAHGRTARHRAIGRIGTGLGAAFVLSALLLAHHGLGRMPPEVFAREGRFVYLPLAMAVLFGLALALAIAWRRVPALHGRFMAATALTLLDPLFARLLYLHGPRLPADVLYQVPAFVTFGAVLAALTWTLPKGTRGRGAWHAYAGVAVLLLAGFFVVPHAAAWQAFVAAFRSWPLT